MGWYERITATGLPKSVCRCGHSGDGPNSQHGDAVEEGHGACLVTGCDCIRFTWAGWTPHGERLANTVRMIRARHAMKCEKQ